MGSHEFYQMFKEEILPKLYNLFQKQKQREHILTHSNWTKTLQERKITDHYLKNIDIKILNKMLANQTQQCMKKIKHHNHDLLQVCKGNSTFKNQRNPSHNTLKKKNHMIISDVEKHIWKHLTPIHDTKKILLRKTGIEETFLNLIKKISKKLQLTYYLVVKKYMISP